MHFVQKDHFSDASFPPKRAMSTPRKRRVLAQNVTWKVTRVVDSQSEITVYMKYIVLSLPPGLYGATGSSPGGLPRIARASQANWVEWLSRSLVGAKRGEAK